MLEALAVRRHLEVSLEHGRLLYAFGRDWALLFTKVRGRGIPRS
jgi:hypothetical protein